MVWSAEPGSLGTAFMPVRVSARILDIHTAAVTAVALSPFRLNCGVRAAARAVRAFPELARRPPYFSGGERMFTITPAGDHNSDSPGGQEGSIGLSR
jgi:hypothetical protein